MRVIERGPEQTHRATCEHCKSLLELVPSDVIDCSAWGTSANCCVCGKRMKLSPPNMSSSFRKQVNWDE